MSRERDDDQRQTEERQPAAAVIAAAGESWWQIVVNGQPGAVGPAADAVEAIVRWRRGLPADAGLEGVLAVGAQRVEQF